MINKDINTFEIHYILPPDVHQMDASVEAQCTLQYVKIIKKVAELLQLEVEIDTIAIEEGGLRHWLKIVKEKEDKDATITSDVLKHLLKTIVLLLLREHGCGLQVYLNPALLQKSRTNVFSIGNNIMKNLKIIRQSKHIELDFTSHY